MILVPISKRIPAANRRMSATPIPRTQNPNFSHDSVTSGRYISNAERAYLETLHKIKVLKQSPRVSVPCSSGKDMDALHGTERTAPGHSTPQPLKKAIPHLEKSASA